MSEDKKPEGEERELFFPPQPPPKPQPVIYQPTSTDGLQNLICQWRVVQPLGRIVECSAMMRYDTIFHPAKSGADPVQGIIQFWCNVDSGIWFSAVSPYQEAGRGNFSPVRGVKSMPNHPAFASYTLYWLPTAPLPPSGPHGIFPEFELRVMREEWGRLTHEASWMPGTQHANFIRGVFPHTSLPMNKLVLKVK